MTNATENEAKVMRAIATNYYNSCNGARPSCYDLASDDIWTSLINDSSIPSDIEGRSLSGVISSLVQKGFVQSDGECTSLKETGWDAMVRYFGSLEHVFDGFSI